MTMALAAAASMVLNLRTRILNSCTWAQAFFLWPTQALTPMAHSVFLTSIGSGLLDRLLVQAIHIHECQAVLGSAGLLPAPVTDGLCSGPAGSS